MMKKIKKQTIIKTIALMLATASATFLLCYLGFRNYYGLEPGIRDEMAKYAEVRKDISELYVGDYDEGALTDASISAMIEAMGDRWSFYMTADEYKEYQQNANNQHEGIGITFIRTEDANTLQIVGIASESPAEEAGLSEGELILEINGEPISALESDAVKEKILENLGGNVVLTVQNSQGDIREVEVGVKEYYVNPISFEMRDGGIGYIKISNFEDSSSEKTIAAIKTLTEQGATSLIFDVRDNPGGKVSELLEVLDYLLPKGELFISEDKAGGRTAETSDESCLELPMVVLVNANSYSAAEYFAAILQEYSWADIVGEQTTGKGRSQITINLRDGSALHISTKRYFTPAGVDLSQVGGVVPDYEIMSGTAQDDEQLQKAIEVLSQP